LLLGLFVLAAAVGCAQESNDAVLSESGSGSGRDTDGPRSGDDNDSDNDNESDSDNDGDSSDDGSTGDIDWGECDFGFDSECAEMDVPLDYDDPAGDTITLSIARTPAAGDRIGALFVNPGGPGATASDFAVQMAGILPSAITDRFDIVGVDPRGTGASAIDCGADFAELYGVDYSIDSPEDETTLLDVSQEYVDGCEDEVGDQLAHLGTRDVARDMDTVRAAMGDEQITYVGFSYGTGIGQVYADLFPERVRAMVLDGVLELGPTGVELAEEQSRGFEQALQSFVDDCDADSDCPLAPDAMARIDELSAAVEEAPIDAEPRDLGPGDLAIGLALPLYSEPLWPALANAVDEALDGDGSAMISLADEYLGIGSFDIYFAVNCLDFEWPDDPAELLDDGTAMGEEAPHFGDSIVNDYVRCAMWPTENDPLPEVTAPGTPPILVVSTTNDPATPYEAGVRTAEKLETGVLLSYEGDGHTVVGNGVSCVDDIVVDYLVDLEPPEDGTTC
jgi:pimeloyl-ACP methyl ester carboxylesterase